MFNRFLACNCLALLGGAAASNAAADLSDIKSPATSAVHIMGHYSDKQLASLKNFSLPRTFLYNSSGALIPPERWPGGLAEIKRKVGNAECCTSDKPGPCVPKPFTPAETDHFKGLMNSDNAPLARSQVPTHRWLLVQYEASWCAPCVQEAKALEQYFATTSNSGEFVWISIDMARLAEVQETKTHSVK